MLYRIIPGLVAALLATTAISWLFDPTAAAAGLGMPYLEGIGRSTQVGDFSAFFVFLVVMCIAGVITRKLAITCAAPPCCCCWLRFSALWRGHCTAPSWQRRLLLRNW